MRLIGLIVLMCVAVGVAPPVHAQDAPSPAARREARQVTRSATRHYERHRYEQALEGYQRAYELYPAAGLLFNIAQCHRGLGQHQLAVQRYERYLEERPEARNRALVLDLIAESRAVLAANRARDEEGRASEVSVALSAELERQRAAMAELEAARSELEQARETGEDRRERERERYEAAMAELDEARRELEEARQRVERRHGTDLAVPSREVYEEWWFWTLVVTGVAAVAGGVTLGVVLTQEPGLPSGTLGTIDSR